MMTGIGTPKSQSKIPRPIFCLHEFLSEFKNAKDDAMFPLPSRNLYQCPVFGIDFQGSAAGLASLFCNISIECRSGERTNAISAFSGGNVVVVPTFMNLSLVG